MSYLHISYNGTKKTIYLNDNKSALLDRYINLNTEKIYYTIGKQIAFKPISRTGATGRMIKRIALKAMETPPQEEEWDAKAILEKMEKDWIRAMWFWGAIICAILSYWFITISWIGKGWFIITSLSVWLVYKFTMPSKSKNT